MNKQLVISFKITNWCNLHCAHCCERSSISEPLNLLPVEKIDRYLFEFTKTPMFHKARIVTITGGEVFMPYMYNQPEYIPNLLKIIRNHGFAPALKTNATIGNDEKICEQVLYSITQNIPAQQPIIMDISIDEFHNNVPSVSNIIHLTATTSYLRDRIQPCLVGFYTHGSLNELNNLKQDLINKGLEIHQYQEHDWLVIHNKFNPLPIFLDFYNAIRNHGRALDNNIYNSTSDPNGDNSSNCLQIDNNDYAILNYKYREPINNRPLNAVLYSLMQKAY